MTVGLVRKDSDFGLRLKVGLVVFKGNKSKLFKN